MGEYKEIRAKIYSEQSEKMKAVIQRIQKETDCLSSEELGTLSILFGIEKMIKEEESEKIIQFPSKLTL